MSDISGAPAPAESVAAPVDTAPVTPPAPISTDPIPAEPVKDEPKEPKETAKPVSTRDALKNAAAKVEKSEKEAKPEPVKADKAEPATNRDETGKFASTKPAVPDAKAQTTPSAPHHEPPARFTDDAKAIWKDTPEPVRREAERAIRELTQGHEKYKASAEAFESLKPYHEVAERNGTNLKGVLDRVVQIESMMKQNPIAALQHICESSNVDFRGLIAHLSGQPVDQQQSQSDQTIRELRGQVSRLEQGLTSFKTDIESREASQVINTFKADKPRFDELKADMGFFMNAGRAQTLQEAYELAERLNPASAPAAVPAASSAPTVDPQAQTLRASRSISGSPTPGSNPDARAPSTSIKESLRRAMAQAG